MTGVYDRNDYLPEKRRALGAWAMRLLEIVEGEKSAGNVVSVCSRIGQEAKSEPNFSRTAC